MTGTIKACVVAFMVAAVCTTAGAQPRHRHPHPHRVVTVVTRPAATVHTVNRLTQKERLGMALAYLARNKYLSVKQYAKMTGMKKAAAKAELDAFAHDKATPVVKVKVGKNVLYARK